MTHEYAEQRTFEGAHSWYWNWKRRSGKWGGIAIHRIASFGNRGGVIRVTGYSTNWQEGKAPKLDVYVSDAGQSMHVYLNDRRMVIEEVDSE